MPREISEHDATLAVEAAAKADYERVAKQMLERHGEVATPWDETTPQLKLRWRQEVLDLVWAALGALPDQRHTAWLEGYVAAENDRLGSATPNPYPAEEA